MKKHLWFIVAILVQLAILGSVAAKQIHALVTGKTVLLRTMPVDPYNLMSGYYVTLSYEISGRGEPSLGEVVGLAFEPQKEQTVYVTLEQKGSDPAWKAVAKSAAYPAKLAPGQVVIKGKFDGWGLRFGIEAYFLPETMRGEIEQALRETNSRLSQPATEPTERALVEVTIDSCGNAALTGLKIKDKMYRY